MKIADNLQELTNEFIKNFLELSNKNEGKTDGSDNLYAFNYLLPETIGNSNYPRYDEEHTILMGMSSFDDAIAKKFFNNRIQGFVKII
jgi:hypothetical protein